MAKDHAVAGRGGQRVRASGRVKKRMAARGLLHLRPPLKQHQAGGRRRYRRL